MSIWINDTPVKWFKFPGGEIQVQLNEEQMNSNRPLITWKPKSADDVMKLVMAVSALRQFAKKEIGLEILYLPYARQDRACQVGEAFAAKAMIQIINMLKFDYVGVFDPHSAVSVSLLDNVLVVDKAAIWREHPIIVKNDTLFCAPDAGASKEVFALAMYHDHPMIQAHKSRSMKDGHITHYSIDDYEFNYQDILVIDDICDGGATFLKLAEALKGHKVGDLYLYVTHGIFSKGLDELMKYYKHIYCHHVLDDTKYKSSFNLTIYKEVPYNEN